MLTKKLSAYGACMAMAMAMFAVNAYAIEVDVDSTQPEVAGVSYQTINGALDFVKTQAEPRVVNITGGGPYYENLAINYSVTVRGDEYRPVIVAHPTSGLQNERLNDNAVAFYTTADFPGPQEFHLENLAIIPAIGNSPLRCIYTNNNNTADALTPENMHLFLDGVLIAPNNGSDQPASEDGLDFIPSPAANFNDDPIFVYGLTDLTIENTVITNVHGNPAASVDGIVFYPDVAGHTLTLGPGTVISHMNRMAVQMVRSGTVLNAIGTEDNPVVIKGIFKEWNTGNGAITFFINDADNGIPHKMENVVFIENNSRCIGVSLSTGSVGALEAKNLAFVNNKEAVVAIAGNMNRTWTFTNCTFVGTEPAGAYTGVLLNQILISEATAGANTGTVEFIDSIIAGNGQGDVNTNRINIAAANMTINFTNTALPTAGPYALASDIFTLNGGASAPTQVATINDDPEFVLVGADFTNVDFLDVEASTYAGAATGGADLSGYGDYVGGSSVGDWNLY